MNVTDTAVEHVLAKLRADSTLNGLVGGRIHEGAVPENPAPTYPLVLVQVYGDAPLTPYNGPRISHGDVDVTVRVVGYGDDSAPLVPTKQAIGRVLHATTGTYEDGQVRSCTATKDLQPMAEVKAGRTVRYLGYRFTLTVS